MPFTKSDLLYSYSWTHTKEDDPKLKGEPDASLLNRNEGYEVLYMIRKIMAGRKLENVSSGQKIERMIKDHPSTLRSQAHVKEWISDQWNNY